MHRNVSPGGQLAQLVEHRLHTAGVTGSSPVLPTTKSGAVVKTVITPACHAGGRGFKSLPLRQNFLFCRWLRPTTLTDGVSAVRRLERQGRAKAAKPPERGCARGSEKGRRGFKSLLDFLLCSFGVGKRILKSRAYASAFFSTQSFKIRRSWGVGAVFSSPQPSSFVLLASFALPGFGRIK